MFLINTALHSRLYGKVLSRSRALSYSKNTTENLFTTENAEISDDFWKRQTQLYFSYYKRAFFIKASKYRRFGNDIVQSVSVVFHGAFRLLFFTIRNHLCADERRCRLRHKIHAIKTRPNNPLRFLQHKNSIRLYLANDFTCAARKATFRTQKRFHNKQYTSKSKDQPFESERTLFDIGFNNGSIAMHRQTLIFLLSHKITTVQQKTTNRNNQSHQTIRKNNPHNHSIKNTQKTNRQNKHEKLSHQSNVKSITENNRITLATNNYSFFHIKTCCRRKLPRKPANNTHLIKTWHNRTRQPG